MIWNTHESERPILVSFGNGAQLFQVAHGGRAQRVFLSKPTGASVAEFGSTQGETWPRQLALAVSQFRTPSFQQMSNPDGRVLGQSPGVDSLTSTAPACGVPHMKVAAASIGTSPMRLRPCEQQGI